MHAVHAKFFRVASPLKKEVLAWIGILALGSLIAPTALAQNGTFNYQGRLSDGAGAADGIYDFRFRLMADPSADTSVGTEFVTNAVPASNGLFNVSLEFGPGVFNGSPRWLEIAVRTNGANTYVTLSPRQPLTPAPYASFALNAGTSTTASNAGMVAASNVVGTISPTQISGLTSNQLDAATWQLATNLNGGNAALASNVVAGISLTNALITNSVFAGDGSGLTNLNAGQLSAGVLTNNQSGVVFAGLTTVSNLAVAGTNFVNHLVLSNAPAFNGAAITNLNAAHLTGTISPTQISGLTSNQLDAATWQLATNLNGGNAALASNVVAGISLTNAFITNSVFAGDGSGLTNLNAGQLSAGVLTNNQSGVVFAGLTTVSNLSVAGTNFVNHLVLSNAPAFNGAAITNLNAAHLTGTISPTQLSGLTSNQLDAATWQLATNLNGGNAALASNVVAGISLTNAFITNSVFAGDGSGLTNLNAGQLSAGVLTNNQSGVVFAGLTTVSNLSVAGTNFVNHLVLSNAPTFDGGGITNLNAAQLTGTISPTQISGLTSNQLDAATWQLATNLNGGNAALASNVVAGISLTNALITNSVFAGDGSGLTNLSAGQLSAGVLTNNQSGVVFAGVTTVSNLSVTSTNFVNHLVLSNAPTFDGGGITNLNAAQLTGTISPTQISGLTSNQLDAATWQLATNLNGGNAALASNVVAGISLTNALITNSVFAGDGSGLTNLSAGQLSAGVLTNNQSGVVFAGVTTVSNLSVTSTNFVNHLVLSNAPTFDGGGITNLNAAQLTGTISPTQISGLTSNQLDAATWQLATNLNGGNAALASNVVAGISLTNAFITNSVFAGDGSGLTNLNAGQLSAGVLTNNQSGVVFAGLTTVSNLSVAGTNFVNHLVLSNAPAFNGGAITNLNAAQLTGTISPTQISGLTSNQLDAATWQLATNLNGGNAALASNVVAGISLTNALITNSVFAGDGSGLTNLNAGQLSAGVLTNNQSGVAFAGLTTVSNLSVAGTNFVNHLVLSNAPAFDGGGITNLNAAQLTGTISPTQISGLTSNQLDAATWQLATNLNGGNAALASNVVAGIGLTNAFITNSVFAGDGSGLTNLNAGQLAAGVLTNNQSGVVFAGLTTVSNLSVAGTNFVNHLVLSNAPAFNGGAITNLNAAQLTGTVPLGQLPASLLTVNSSNVVLSGNFAGNGAGLTNTGSRRVLFASREGCKLDSNVDTGGGTDDSANLQRLLDQATNGPLELVIDGPALVTTNLVVGSNTRIRCLPGAGCFLRANAQTPMLIDKLNTTYSEANIEVVGGVWNVNGLHQPYIQHDSTGTNAFPVYPNIYMTPFWFAGVSNLALRDLEVRQGTLWGILINDCKDILIENLYLNDPIPTPFGGDGLHFIGSVYNVRIINFRCNRADDALAFNMSEGETFWTNDTRFTTAPNVTSNAFVDGARLEGKPGIGIHLGRFGWGSAPNAFYGITLKNIEAWNCTYGFGGTLHDPGTVLVDGLVVHTSPDIAATGLLAVSNAETVIINKVTIDQQHATENASPLFQLIQCTNVAMHDIISSWDGNSGGEGTCCLVDLTEVGSAVIQNVIQHGGDSVLYDNEGPPDSNPLVLVNNVITTDGAALNFSGVVGGAVTNVLQGLVGISPTDAALRGTFSGDGAGLTNVTASALRAASTNEAPISTNLVRGWVSVTVGGQTYKLPLYQ